MSENSSTAVDETEAKKTIEIYLAEAGVDAMLKAIGLPFPDAADIDHVIVHVDHSPIINSPEFFGDENDTKK